MVKEKSLAHQLKVKRTSKKPLSAGVGRRKGSAVARVYLRPGSGGIRVNGLDYTKYFDTEFMHLTVINPCKVCPISANYDFDVSVRGGGKMGQADAVKLGIAKALVKFDEALRPALREHRLLTSDGRIKEPKKYGRKAARRKFQFVKR